MLTVDVRRLAVTMPGVADDTEGERLVFSVAGKQIAWTYLERFHPDTPRRPRPDVLAIRCPLERKELLITAAPARFFDDNHYRGYTAVLVRLNVIEEDELASLLEGASRLQLEKRKRNPASPG